MLLDTQRAFAISAQYQTQLGHTLLLKKSLYHLQLWIARQHFLMLNFRIQLQFNTTLLVHQFLLLKDILRFSLKHRQPIVQ